MLRKASRLAAFITFMITVLAAAGASAAPDAHAVADAFIAAFNANGKVVASYGDATASGDTITIANFKAVQPKRTGRDVSIASIVMTGVAERQPGGFTAASMTFNDGSATYRQGAVKWQTAVVADVVIPTPKEVKSLSNKIQPFTTASVTGITFTDPELEQPVDIAKVDLAMAADANGEPDSFTFSTTGIHLPASAFKAPEVKGMMQGLGYTDLVLSINFDAGFNTAADTFTLRSFALDIADVGKLAITGAFSNVKVHNMVGTGNPGTSGSAGTNGGAGTNGTNGGAGTNGSGGANGAITPAPGKSPSLDALSIRFDNAGVIQRALDMQAQILGTTREDVAAQWPMLFMFLIGDAGGMDFQNKVQTALTDFLKSPKSLTITLAPPAPVPFSKVAETLDADQTKLPELLGIDIKVNN